MVRNTVWFSLLFLGAAVLGARPASPQELTADELEDLVAPVALYPDDVLGIILPASTFPLDIVRAARFLEDREEDSSLEPDPEWDDSIVALLNYPEVLRMMDENIDWTWELGEAVLTDQEAVLDAAQVFRSRALAAGNLQSDDRQTVANDNGAITIVPADPKVVYIPVYEPREVVVYHAAPIWHYYPVAYPVYYYPYPYGYSFNVGFFWGVTSYFSIGWHSHYVHVHHHTHYGHPYYLNSYYSYAPYYPRNHVNVTLVVNDYDNVWVPGPRRGGRPEMVSVEGRASAARMTRTSTVESRSAGAPRTATVESQTAGAPRASTSRMTTGGSPSARSATGNPVQTRPSRDQARAPETGETTVDRQSTRQSATTSGSTSTTRMTSQPSTRPSPRISNSPQTSNRPSTQTRTPSSPPSSTRMAPQGSTTRTAPQTSSRPAPQTSTRSAAPSSAPRSMSSSQPSSGGSTRSGSSSAPRAQGTTRSGGGNGSSSSARQSPR